MRGSAAPCFLAVSKAATISGFTAIDPSRQARLIDVYKRQPHGHGPQEDRPEGSPSARGPREVLHDLSLIHISMCIRDRNAAFFNATVGSSPFHMLMAKVMEALTPKAEREMTAPDFAS